MNQHVVVKQNWVASLSDQVSEFFWTYCVGLPLLGGIVVTGIGAGVGYLKAPQGESEVPYMVEGIKEAHVNSWKTIHFVIKTTGEVIQELRPAEPEEVIEPLVLPHKPLPENVIPQPITNDVPEVGECDPYGPLDFSYDPPKLVCEVIHG